YDVKAKLSERPVHNKGVIVDGEKVLVSSINWNHNSVTNNREAGLIIESENAGEYFAQVFESDWKGAERSGSKLPLGDYTLEILIIIVVAGIGAWLAIRVV
ncbi:MAG: phospholipase D-like domain-containing protein, partial [Halobacteria archaeon]|nr:phospholipase D-like domain-containing protein [Halobacteria archaeon]